MDTIDILALSVGGRNASIGKVLRAVRPDVYIRPQGELYEYTATGALVQFTTGVSAPLVECIAAFSPVQSGSGDPSASNPRPISGWDGLIIYVSPTGSTSDATTYPVSWSPSTIYGGTIDLVSGELTVTHASVLIDSVNWHNEGSNTNRQAWSLSQALTNYKAPDSTSKIPNAISTIFRPVSATSTLMPYYLSYLKNYPGRLQITFAPNTYADQAEMKTAMAGVPIVYELETPETYELTPVSVRAFRGANYIWSNAGEDIAVVYKDYQHD